MNTKKIMAGLILLIAGASFACKMSGGNNAETANVASVNPNSNVNAQSNKATTENKRDPKTICAYLPDFTPGEYKALTADLYSCNSKNSEKLKSGKVLIFEYTASGKADNVESIKFQMTANSSIEENSKGEERLVETAETLWQKVFAAPLPGDIKAELLKNKGKMLNSRKEFKEPVFGWVERNSSGGIYGLEIYFSLPK